MMIRWPTLLLFALCNPACADTLIAKRTLRAQTIIGAEDVSLVAGPASGENTAPSDAIGLETRVAIYQGRPIRLADLGPPSTVERNQIVTLAFRSDGLTILAEGRALARGGPGDRIRVMNLASRTTVNALIEPDGTLSVAP